MTECGIKGWAELRRERPGCDQARPTAEIADAACPFPFDEGRTTETTSARGRLNEKVEPSPGLETSHRRPSIAWTSWRAMYSPSQVPPTWRSGRLSAR